MKEGYGTRDEGYTLLIDSDLDYPGLASNLGFIACGCGETDGTISCNHYTASNMIRRAAEFLDNHLGIMFDDPGYFEEEQ